MATRDRRRKHLLDILRAENQLTVEEVCRRLSVSESTARRMFSELEHEGVVLRLHGGVCLVPAASHDYSYSDSLLQHEGAKEALGRAAASLVASGERVFLDSGTTIVKLAQALATRIIVGEVESVVVVTNSLPNTVPLSPVCRVILVGGEVREQRRDVCGALAETALGNLHVHSAFLGADAIHLRHGLMTTDERAARMNEIVIDHSDRAVVVADSSKFGKSSFASYAAIDQVNAIFTDSGISSEVIDEFTDIAAELKVVNLNAGNDGDSANSIHRSSQ